MLAVNVFVLLSVGLLLGKLARINSPLLRRLFVPSSIIGGLIALIGGPEIWGRLVPGQPGGLVGPEVYQACAKIPGFLINIVFAALFLGTQLPSVREIWRRAGPQVAFGQAMAWGMYMVGLGLTVAVLTPIFDVPPVFGTLLEIGFEGGHGTAAGLDATFRAADWPEGTDLALGVATVGVLAGMFIGMLLINWAVARGHTVFLTRDGYRTPEDRVEDGNVGLGVSDEESADLRDSQTLGAGHRPESGHQPQSGHRPPTANHSDTRGRSVPLGRWEISSIEPISLHVAYIGVAVGIGMVLLVALQALERWTLTRMGVPPLLEHVPLFPMAMIGGLIVQRLHDRWLSGLRLQREVFERLQGIALDYLIVSAMAALSLRALAANWQPLVLLIGFGLAWVIGMLLLLGPRMLPDYWFERGIGDFGQSMGVTATGLLLLKIVDPQYRSPALEAFGYKQLLFEPFVGGGLVTAMAVPLVFQFGPWPLLVTSTVLTLFWIAFGLFFFGRRRSAASSG
jgi:ESS family glutamate:Na+ symporter